VGIPQKHTFWSRTAIARQQRQNILGCRHPFRYKRVRPTRRGRRRANIHRREKVGADVSCLPPPPVRPAPGARHVSAGKGRARLLSQWKKAGSNRRAHNQTEAGRQSLRQRVVVEHRIAWRVQLGIRQSRYLGRTKTCLQVVMAAVVANLSWVVGYSQRQAEPAGTPSPDAATAAKTGLLGALLVVWTRIFVRPEPVLA
jgi:hypothetical protein